MGSISAMNSINRVLELHGNKIKARLLEGIKSSLVKDILLFNNVYEIQVVYVLADDTEIVGYPLDIDRLAEEYPDCEVGY